MIRSASDATYLSTETFCGNNRTLAQCQPGVYPNGDYYIITKSRQTATGARLPFGSAHELVVTLNDANGANHAADANMALQPWNEYKSMPLTCSAPASNVGFSTYSCLKSDSTKVGKQGNAAN
jgi:hypothetical protein